MRELRHEDRSHQEHTREMTELAAGVVSKLRETISLAQLINYHNQKLLIEYL